MRINDKTKTKLQKHSRTLFFLLALILLLGIATQIVLACLAVFVDGGLWQIHRTIMNVIEFIPAIMFILGIVGGITKLHHALSFLLFFMIQFQYYNKYGWQGAIHASLAIFLFMISLYVAWSSYRFVVSKKKENNDIMQQLQSTSTGKIQKHFQTLFILLAWLLLIGLFIQISLAGLAIFFDGGLWKYHKDLVYIMEFVPVVMFVVGNLGQIHKLYRALTFLLFFIFNFQYYTTFSWIGIFHAVFTLLIFMMTLFIAWGSYRSVANSKKENSDNKQQFQKTGTGI
ncbi:DUF6220 domain-containing protein [Bacillus marasmi]|uniref:DUF6220 domain-containing protein n=1 Tax=Bacillus marasmi TaxID=1926279 RepID=UPI0011C6F43D|nr:DUF6220 domain-containing protein [Bacillus marasmi]